jgi:Zn-dependent metalloprotease
MLSSSALLLFLAAAATLSLHAIDAASNGTVGGGGGLSPSAGSASVFLTGGELGVVPPSALSLIEEDPAALRKAAGRTLKEILETHFGYTGEEAIKPISSQAIAVDKQNNVHIRFKQHVEGLPIEGASLALHFSGRTGEVWAMNGEVHSFDSIILNSTTDMDCDAAMEVAVQEYKEELVAAGRISLEGEWLSECEVAAVQGRDGKAYMAYKKLFGYQPPPRPVEQSSGAVNTSTTVLAETEPYQMDLIFAERPTGRFVAVHPKVFGARTMVTYHCNFLEASFLSQCDVVSTSPNKINSGDPTVDLAHNNVVDVYNFYLQKFGRKSMDGNDMTIQTLTHYGFLYNNAFFSPEEGGVLGFGDGDQVFFGNWAELDVGTCFARSLDCANYYHFVCPLTRTFLGCSTTQLPMNSPMGSLTSLRVWCTWTRVGRSMKRSRMPWEPTQIVRF